MVKLTTLIFKNFIVHSHYKTENYWSMISLFFSIKSRLGFQLVSFWRLRSIPSVTGVIFFGNLTCNQI